MAVEDTAAAGAGEETPRSWVVGTVVAGAALQLGAVVAVLVLRALDGGAVDGGFGGLALGTVYGMPGVLALLGLRRRWPLLLAAGIASLVLAVVPFSLHSFVFGPVGVAYLVACGSWRAPRPSPGRAVAVVVAVPALLLTAFVALLWHEDPLCYERDADGTVTVDRDPASVTSGTQTIDPGSGIVEAGCSSDSVVWWEAATSVALAAAALGVGVGLTRTGGLSRADGW